METEPRRKGAMRMADIPPPTCYALCKGRRGSLWFCMTMNGANTSLGRAKIALEDRGNDG